MSRMRTLSLLIPLLLVGCDRPNDPVEPQASAPAATTAPAATMPATPATATTAPTAPMTTPAPASSSAPMAASSDAAMTAQAMLMPTQGRSAGGELSLTPESGGLRLSGRLTGLTAGAAHGFHIHEKGDCSAPDASSAGPHFNPAGNTHGNVESGPHHAGDMPNVTADAQGQVEVSMLLPELELGSNGPRDVLGRAIVVHEQPDDYTSQPAGNSGARIACGVIGRTVAPSAEEIPASEPPPG
jgi:Cu-Zn family superoxide dismutase